MDAEDTEGMLATLMAAVAELREQLSAVEGQLDELRAYDSDQYPHVQVAVDDESAPQFMGTDADTGAIRSDDDSILMSVPAGEAYKNLQVANAMPAGTYRGQMAWWDETLNDDAGGWEVSDQSAATVSPSLMVYDTAEDEDGSWHPVELTEAYRGIFRNTGGEAVSDVPRFTG